MIISDHQVDKICLPERIFTLEGRKIGDLSLRFENPIIQRLVEDPENSNTSAFLSGDGEKGTFIIIE